LEQNCPGGHSTNQQDFMREAKEAFAAEVAGSAAAMIRKQPYTAVFLAAPGRLNAILRRGLAGKAHIAGELNRDLTKAPDAELDRWLPARPISLAPG
jgi:protein required for attachment to host cells